MPVPEKTVVAVVTDVSKRMSDPTYAQVAVGSFAQAHPDAARYVTAHADELGGTEAVVHAIFHAEVMAECVRRHAGRSPSRLSFADLDEAAHADQLLALRRVEPSLADYLASNVESDAMRRVVALVAMALRNAAG
jgi:hypothetical protein